MASASDGTPGSGCRRPGDFHERISGAAGRGRFGFRFAVGLIAGTLFLFPFSFSSSATTDRNADARNQFATAVRMRTMLEGYLEKDRSADNYKQTIDAYQKVYLISERSEDVPPALIAEAELYEEMGHL